MSVIRVNHERNYVVLQKECLENPNISLKAKGLWAYCLSKPDHWEFHLTQLVDCLKEGRDSIRSAMDELIQYGYCIRTQNKDDLGRYIGVDYEIFETSKLKKCLPLLGFPTSADPTLVSNDRKVSKEKTTPTPSKGVVLSFELFKNISTEEEYALALKAYESAKLEKAISDPVRYIKGIIKHIREERLKSKVGKENKAFAEEVQKDYQKHLGKDQSIKLKDTCITFSLVENERTHYRIVDFCLSKDSFNKKVTSALIRMARGKYKDCQDEPKAYDPFWHLKDIPIVD